MTSTIQITDQTFADTINNNEFVVLLYSGDHCSPCKAFAPTFEGVAKNYAGRAVFGKINVDEFSYLAEHQVRAIPQVVIIKNRQVMEKLIGAITDVSFRSVIQKYIN